MGTLENFQGTIARSYLRQLSFLVIFIFFSTAGMKCNVSAYIARRPSSFRRFPSRLFHRSEETTSRRSDCSEPSPWLSPAGSTPSRQTWSREVETSDIPPLQHNYAVLAHPSYKHRYREMDKVRSVVHATTGILAPFSEVMYYCSSPKCTAECTKSRVKFFLKMFPDYEPGSPTIW